MTITMDKRTTYIIIYTTLLIIKYVHGGTNDYCSNFEERPTTPQYNTQKWNSNETSGGNGETIPSCDVDSRCSEKNIPQSCKCKYFNLVQMSMCGTNDTLPAGYIKAHFDLDFILVVTNVNISNSQSEVCEKLESNRLNLPELTDLLPKINRTLHISNLLNATETEGKIFYISYFCTHNVNQKPILILINSKETKIKPSLLGHVITNVDEFKQVLEHPERYVCNITLEKNTVIFISAYGAPFHPLKDHLKVNRSLEFINKRNKLEVYKYHQNYKKNKNWHLETNQKEEFQLRYRSTAKDESGVLFAVPIRVLKGSFTMRCSVIKKTEPGIKKEPAKSDHLILILVIVIIVLVVIIVSSIAIIGGVFFHKRRKSSNKDPNGSDNGQISVRQDNEPMENNYVDHYELNRVTSGFYCELDDINVSSNPNSNVTTSQPNGGLSSHGNVPPPTSNNAEEQGGMGTKTKASDDNAYDLETEVNKDPIRQSTVEMIKNEVYNDDDTFINSNSSQHEENKDDLSHKEGNRNSVTEMITNDVYNSNESNGVNSEVEVSDTKDALPVITSELNDDVKTNDPTSKHDSKCNQKEENRKSITEMITNDVYNQDGEIIIRIVDNESEDSVTKTDTYM